MYTGIAASVTEPIVSLGTPVKIIVEQVSDGGAVYADLYRDGSLVHATSGMLKGARATLSIRPKRPGLYRLQLYTLTHGGPAIPRRCATSMSWIRAKPRRPPSARCSHKPRSSILQTPGFERFAPFP